MKKFLVGIVILISASLFFVESSQGKVVELKPDTYILACDDLLIETSLLNIVQANKEDNIGEITIRRKANSHLLIHSDGQAVCEEYRLYKDGMLLFDSEKHIMEWN